jgi:SAM-dependent methyltransferase
MHCVAETAVSEFNKSANITRAERGVSLRATARHRDGIAMAVYPVMVTLMAFLAFCSRVYAQQQAQPAEQAQPTEQAQPAEQAEQAEVDREPDVIFVPTPQDVVDRMLELAKVKKDDVLYDLGCGDGRIVVTAAKKYGCKAKGFDIDPQRVKESLENVQENKVQELATIERRDIFKLDLSEATVVTLYLLPSLNVKLVPQLKKLKPGARIVSHDFRMKGFKPEKVVKLDSKEDNYGHRIFLWTAPLKAGAPAKKKPAAAASLP